MNDRLYRSRSDRMLAGVAGGVAEHFELDPSLVRVGWAILVILSGGIFLLIYIVMAIVVPEEPGTAGGWSPAGPGGWTSTWPASGPSNPAATGPSPAGPDPAAAGPERVGPSDRMDPALPPAPDGPGFAAPLSGPSQPGPAQPADPQQPGWGWSGQSPADARRAARDARRAARRARRGSGDEHAGTGGIMAGLILVALGLYFLVRTFAPQLDIDRYWPAGLIVLGVILVGLSIRRTPGGSAP